MRNRGNTSCNRRECPRPKQRAHRPAAPCSGTATAAESSSSARAWHRGIARTPVPPSRHTVQPEESKKRCAHSYACAWIDSPFPPPFRTDQLATGQAFDTVPEVATRRRHGNVGSGRLALTPDVIRGKPNMGCDASHAPRHSRSEEHTSELQSPVHLV